MGRIVHEELVTAPSRCSDGVTELGLPTMNIIACIIVGIIAGWLAERIMGRNHGLIMNLIVGIVGALIGGFLTTRLLGLRYDEGVNLASIAVATLGAVILLALFGGVRRRQPWS